MPIKLKNAGIWTPDMKRGEAFANDMGTWKQVEQIYVKDTDIWVPMFPALRLPRWGLAKHAGSNLQGHTGIDPAGGQYDSWTGPQDFIDSELITLWPDEADNHHITLDVPYPYYVYFASPTSLGTATFYDVATGWPGGWDGATWEEDGGFSDTYGPITVTYDDGNGPVDWYVYRTDFSGIGQIDFRIEFSNN